MELAVALMVVSVWAENMWSAYGDDGELLEKNIESVAAAPKISKPITSFPYVLNDMATFFTLLVGIYFPSVTGKDTLTSPLLFFQFFFPHYVFSCIVL